MPERKLVVSLAVISTVIALGTIGFHVIEGASLADSLYWTIVTITTVGYGDITPKTHAGRIFASFLILFGVAAIIYFAENVFARIMGEKLLEIVGMRRIPKELLKNHYIVIGYGRIGRSAVEELRAMGERFVVVEKDENVVRNAPPDIPIILGDGGDEEILKRVGIDKAKGILVTTGSDAENILITLTARTLNPELVIVVRANSEENIGKIYRAGADRVILPEVLGGRMMAKAAKHPHIIDLLDRVVIAKDLVIGQTLIEEGSEIEGKTIEESEIEERTGAKILAIVKDGGETIVVTPDRKSQLEKGASLIMVGTREQLEKAQRMGRRSQGGEGKREEEK